MSKLRNRLNEEPLDFDANAAWARFEREHVGDELSSAPADTRPPMGRPRGLLLAIALLISIGIAATLLLSEAEHAGPNLAGTERTGDPRRAVSRRASDTERGVSHNPDSPDRLSPSRNFASSTDDPTSPRIETPTAFIPMANVPTAHVPTAHVPTAHVPTAQAPIAPNPAFPTPAALTPPNRVAVTVTPPADQALPFRPLPTPPPRDQITPDGTNPTHLPTRQNPTVSALTSGVRRVEPDLSSRATFPTSKLSALPVPGSALLPIAWSEVGPAAAPPPPPPPSPLAPAPTRWQVSAHYGSAYEFLKLRTITEATADAVPALRDRLALERQSAGLQLRYGLTPRFGLSLTLDASQRTDRTAFTEPLTRSRMAYHPEASSLDGVSFGDSVLATVTDTRTVRSYARHHLVAAGIAADYLLLEGPAWSLRGVLGARLAVWTGFGGSRTAAVPEPGSPRPLTSETPYADISPWRYDVGLRGERRVGSSLLLLLDARAVLGARYRFDVPGAAAPVSELGTSLGLRAGLGYRF